MLLKTCFALIFPLLVTTSALSYPLTPEVGVTPGDLCSILDPDFDGFRYEEQIPHCTRRVTERNKREVYTVYAIEKDEQPRYTIDHLIPLSLGGSNHVTNLWPEHVLVKATRQDLEQQLYDKLRRGETTQQQAIAEILQAKFGESRFNKKGEK